MSDPWRQLNTVTASSILGFAAIPREKPSKDTSEETSSGKPIEIPEGIAKATEAEKAGPSTEVNLLSREEKLDHLDLSELKSNTET